MQQNTDVKTAPGNWGGSVLKRVSEGGLPIGPHQAHHLSVEWITQALKKGVPVLGFGAFEARNRAGRQGRNPKTGEVIEIVPSIVPAFKPGKELKDALALV